MSTTTTSHYYWPDVQMSGPEDPDYTGTKHTTVLYAGVLLTSMTSISFLFNFLLITAILIKKRYEKTYQLAYLNLAVADTLFSLFGATFRGPGIMVGFSSELHCKISVYLAYLTTYTDLIAVIPITLDRAVAVLLPIRYGRNFHVRVLKITIASNWFISGLYLLARMGIGHSFNSDLIVYDPEAMNECWLDDWKHKKVVSWLGITLFMVTPLLINIICYTLILIKLRSDRLKSINSVTILTRSILICTSFTLSWMPSVIIGDILQLQDFGWTIVGKWFFYLNCLTDPILYAFSSKPITACLNKLQMVKSNSSISFSRSSQSDVLRLRKLSGLNKVQPARGTSKVGFSISSTNENSKCEEDEEGEFSSCNIKTSSLPTIASE